MLNTKRLESTYASEVNEAEPDDDSPARARDASDARVNTRKYVSAEDWRHSVVGGCMHFSGPYLYPYSHLASSWLNLQN